MNLYLAFALLFLIINYHLEIGKVSVKGTNSKEVSTQPLYKPPKEFNSEEVSTIPLYKPSKVFNSKEVSTQPLYKTSIGINSEEVSTQPLYKPPKEFNNEEVSTQPLYKPTKEFNNEEVSTQPLYKPPKEFNSEEVSTIPLYKPSKVFNSKEVSTQPLYKTSIGINSEEVSTQPLYKPPKEFNNKEVSTQPLYKPPKEFNSEEVSTIPLYKPSKVFNSKEVSTQPLYKTSKGINSEEVSAKPLYKPPKEFNNEEVSTIPLYKPSNIQTTVGLISDETQSQSTGYEQQCLNPDSCKTVRGEGLWYCYDNDPCFNISESYCCRELNDQRHIINGQTYHCIPKSFIEIHSTGFGYLAVDSCPDRYNNTSALDLCRRTQTDILGCPAIDGNTTVSELCKNGKLEDSGPFVIHDKSVVFKNKFCALCNEISDFEFFNVFYTVRNSFYDQVSALPRNAAFEVLAIYRHEMIPPPGSNVTTCTFNTKTTNISFQCKHFTNPVVISNNRSFQHKDCKENFDSQFRNYYSEEKEWTNKSIGKKNQLLSVFFKFHAKEVDEIEEGCLVWEEQMRTNGKCKDLDLFSNPDKVMDFYMLSNSALAPQEFSILGHLLSMTFESELSMVMRDYIFIVEENQTLCRLRIIVRFLKTAFKHEVEHFFRVLHHRQTAMNIRLGKDKFPIHVNVSPDVPNITSDHLFKPYLRYLYTLEKMRLNIFLNGFKFDPKAISCSLSINALANFTKLVVQEVFCNTIKDPIDPAGINIENIITYICFGVSIVSLVCLVVLQRQYGMVTNIPSSNTENIAVSLLLSNFLFVVGVQANVTTSLCFLIGVSLHYLWLLVFVFMAIAVVSIAFVVTKLQARRFVSPCVEKRQRVILSLLGIGLPIPIVAGAVFLDVYGPRSWSAGYDTVPCFPSVYPANLLFFTGPILLIITFNLVCLIYIICRVCAVRIETANVRKLNPYDEAKIYLRMSASSGVLWFVGILDSLVDEEWLSFAFTIVCGLQGFFIALSHFTSKQFYIRKKENNTNITS